MKFRFSIRSLFVAIALIAMSLALYRHFSPPPAYPLPSFNMGWPLNANSYLFGDNSSFEVSEQTVKQTPKWNPHHGNPPLSAYDAMVRADKLRLQLIKD